ncbi:MAG: tetratricopeptide repeat protein [Candidatus Omnitrophica bacterium]|nr:tetratricopeptide repeat protein [Candidatus Omnitrophota bacterium]
MYRLFTVLMLFLFCAKSYAVDFPLTGYYRVKDKYKNVIVEWKFQNGRKFGLQKIFSPTGRGLATVKYRDGEIIRPNFSDRVMISNLFFSAAKRLEKAGSKEEALEVYKEAVNIWLESEDANYYLARLYVQLGNREKAVEVLEEFLKNVEAMPEWRGTVNTEKNRKFVERLREE